MKSTLQAWEVSSLLLLGDQSKKSVENFSLWLGEAWHMASYEMQPVLTLAEDSPWLILNDINHAGENFEFALLCSSKERQASLFVSGIKKVVFEISLIAEPQIKPDGSKAALIEEALLVLRN